MSAGYLTFHGEFTCGIQSTGGQSIKTSNGGHVDNHAVLIVAKRWDRPFDDLQSPEEIGIHLGASFVITGQAAV